jgi:hypothetical protein
MVAHRSEFSSCFWILELWFITYRIFIEYKYRKILNLILKGRIKKKKKKLGNDNNGKP